VPEGGNIVTDVKAREHAVTIGARSGYHAISPLAGTG
jgi:hypothetical protein